MSRIPLFYIFIMIYICFLPKTAEANSYKTQNLKYDIKIDIPEGWKIAPKDALRKLAVVPELEFLLIAEGIKYNKQIPPFIIISIGKGANLYTEERLANFSLSDFQSIHDKYIADAVNYNKRQEYEKIDLASIRIFIEKVDELLALGKSYNTRTFDNKYYTTIRYDIPMQYGDLSIEVSFDLDKEAILGPIMDKILSSIKIGKIQLQVDDIDTFLNSLRK